MDSLNSMTGIAVAGFCVLVVMFIIVTKRWW